MENHSTTNAVLEKFKKIEHNFNKNFLLTLYQITDIVAPEDGEEDVKRSSKEEEQYELLSGAYTRWFTKISKDSRNMEACNFFYDAVQDNHKLLLGKDEAIFTFEGDFFSKVFDQEGLDTTYLYNLLSEGGDVDDDDAKQNLWNAFIGLYRLAVLICIYLKMPLVKEIIDMILLSNPDLNQSNIFEKIFTDFKGKSKLRKLIMKLLKSKEDNFGEIFNSLQRVIATFSSEVNMDTDMKANMDRAKDKVSSLFKNLLESAGVTDLSEEFSARLIKSLEDKDEGEQEALVAEGALSTDQMEEVKKKFVEQGLDKMNIAKTVRDLGGTMEKMMSAINSGSEEEMQKILQQSGAGLNLGDMKMEDLQKEMENFDVDEGDDSEDSDPEMPDLVEDGDLSEKGPETTQ
jgi:hypothetical protein